MEIWTTAAPAVSAAFLASLVEVVEAFTIVLAVATLRGWRPAATGTLAALLVLGAAILAFGPLIGRIPIHVLQFAIGIPLLLFGMGWLRKAVLRSAGILALHDEDAAFASETRRLADAEAKGRSQDWIAGLTAFKGVLLEGTEVAFIVIAVGSGRGLLGAATVGALAACLVVFAAGVIIHKPLSRVPENALKFVVAVMLTAFGVFWIGEGLGAEWPAGDAILPVLAVLFLAVGVIVARTLRTAYGGVTP